MFYFCVLPPSKLDHDFLSLFQRKGEESRKKNGENLRKQRFLFEDERKMRLGR